MKLLHCRSIRISSAMKSLCLPSCIVGDLLVDRIGRNQTTALGFAYVQPGWRMETDPNSLSALRSTIWRQGFRTNGSWHRDISVWRRVIFHTAARPPSCCCSNQAGAAIGTEVFTPIQKSLASDFEGLQAVCLIGAAIYSRRSYLHSDRGQKKESLACPRIDRGCLPQLVGQRKSHPRKVGAAEGR